MGLKHIKKSDNESFSRAFYLLANVAENSRYVSDHYKITIYL
jgi:hypothetical protein